MFANSAVVEDTVIRLRPAAGASSVYGAQAQGTSTFRHVTILGSGAAGTHGAFTQAPNQTNNLIIRDSAITGVAVPLRRFQDSGSGSATIAYRYTWLDRAKPFLEQGAGCNTSPGPGNPAE